MARRREFPHPLRVSDGSNCAYPFGSRPGISCRFADEFQGHLRETSICTATEPAKLAVTTMQQLRAIRDGTALPDLFGSVRTVPADNSMEGRTQAQPASGPCRDGAFRTWREYRTQTGDDGSYAFQDLPKDQYQVKVELPEGRVAYRDGAPADRHTRKDVWKPGNPCPVNFDVYYTGRSGGTNTRRAGQPGAGHIFALYQGPEKLNATLVGMEVVDGHFGDHETLARLLQACVQSGRTAASNTRWPG